MVIVLRRVRTANIGQMPHAALVLFCCALLSLAFPPHAAAQPTPNRRPAVTATDLAVLRDLDALSVSLDGTRAVFQLRWADPLENRYHQEWHVIEVQRGQPRYLADAGEPILPRVQGRVMGFIRPHRALWSHDNKWIYYLRREDERTAVWRTHVDGRRTEQLTSFDRDAVALRLSADGQHLLVQTEMGELDAEGLLESEARSGFLYDRRFWPDYGRRPVLTDASDDIWIYEIDRRRQRPATVEEREEFRAPQAFTSPRSSAGAVVHFDARSAERRLGVLLPNNGGAATCAAEECTERGLYGLTWLADEQLIFARQENPNSGLYTWYTWRPNAPSTQTLIDPNHLSARNTFYRDCAPTQVGLLCFQEVSNYPRRLAAVSTEGATALRFDPNHQWRDFALGQEPRHIRITSPDGTSTDGYLVMPRGVSQPLPLVIVTYRCDGFLRGGTGDEYPVFPFVSQGFAVLCYNTELVNVPRQRDLGSYEAYENWARGPGDPLKRRIQSELDAVVDDLVDAGVVDGDRVGLTGLSYGGETVMFALFNMKRLTTGIASGVEIGPTSTFLYGPAAHRDILQRFGLNTPSSDRWRALSVTQNSNRVRAPLLLNVPDRELVSALHPVFSLREENRAVEMFVFPDEYHIKWQPAHRLAIYNRNIDWMNFWLRGVESGLTGDRMQYERWRAIRENQCRLFGPNGTERYVRPRGHEHLSDDDLVPWYCRPGGLDEPAH